MRAVHLSRRLVLEGPERVADGAGGYATQWVALGDLWADVTMRTGREKSGTTDALSLMNFKIVVRGAPYGSSMRPKPDQRFREGERLFRILAVAESDPEGRYLTCFVDEEVVA